MVFSYIPSVKYDNNDEDEEFQAKAMIYLDRAIYRPGQKVYFKGILVQDQSSKTLVAPILNHSELSISGDTRFDRVVEIAAALVAALL